MTRYNDAHWDMEGDFDDMLRDMGVLSYREGVDRVLWFLEDWDGEGQLIRDIQDAIDGGLI